MAGMDTSGALLSSPVRRRILAVLGTPAPPASATETAALPDGLTAAQLATLLDLHVTTVRFHLDQLVAAGLVQAAFHKNVGAGRPRKVYELVAHPANHTSVHESLLLLSTLLTEAFTAQQDHQRPLTPDEIGRRWALEHVPVGQSTPATTPGQWLAKLGQIVDVLRDWGYSPEVRAESDGRSAVMELTHCPFRELARANPDVVCGIHRGLIAGTLSRIGEDDSTVELHPFADGDRCIARLRTTASTPKET